MKKLISLFAALAVVSSLFVTTSYAEVPASVALSVEAKAADADQIAEYEENVDEVPAGYTLYAVTFSQTGLGDWENENNKTTSAQLKKPTGWLPSYIGVQMDFGSDIANLYDDTDFYYVESSFGFGVAVAGGLLTLQYGPWSNSANYALNAKEVAAVEEGEAFAVLYVPVSASATATFTEMTVIDMCQYLDGTPQEVEPDKTDKEYSLQETNISFPASITLGTPDPDEDDPGIAPDDEKVETLSTAEKNYAIAKFSQKINGAKDYYVFAKDAEGKTNIKITENTIAEDDKAAAAKFKVDFGGIKNIDTSGDVSFFALVHSKTHVITAIRLIEVDR